MLWEQGGSGWSWSSHMMSELSLEQVKDTWKCHENDFLERENNMCRGIKVKKQYDFFPRICSDVVGT